MARVARFYGAEVLNSPAWIVDILAGCIDMLRAEESIYQAQAGRVAQYRKRDYQKAVDHWSKTARPAEPEREIELVIPTDESAARWFRENGIPFKSANGPH